VKPELHARAKELFLEACELAPAARAAFVADRAGADGELHAAVQELLANDEAPPALLAATRMGDAVDWLADAGDAAPEDSEPTPARIGAYRIVRVLGRGGMGTVYEAEQENPARRVALKVLQPELGGPQHLQRFRREAQFLARLQHPGIVHVYEAGTAEIGGVVRPYFALELVEGTTLLEHARRAELGTDARLELVAQVCDAVQHAHEHGVLHRDLKPSNIVVDAAGRTKVLDFGVARLLEGVDDATHGPTRTGLIVGTLACMSPEQVTLSAAELDARSDVYALGVVAYELLTGRQPLEVAQLSLPEAARVICEEDPPPAGKIDRRLSGDPETILAKALSKDRADRYASARALGEDLRRYLRREPIAARPASTFYHLRMFARRNRALVAGVVVAALALVIGAVVSVGFAWRESELRVLADGNRARAERAAYRGNVVAAGLALAQFNRAHASTLLTDVERLGSGWEFRRLKRGTEPWIAAHELKVGHAWQASFLGDGSRAIAIGQNGAVEVWEVESGACVRELAADPARADPVALSADAGTVLSVLSVLSVHGNELVLWDTETGGERARVRAPTRLSTDPRSTAALAPDGRHAVVSARADGLFLVDVAAGTMTELVSSSVPAVFDAEGRVLATASPTETALWSTTDGSRLETFARVADARAIALDPATFRIAVAGVRGVRFIDRRDGKVTLAEGPSEAPTALAFSPDGGRLAGMLDDGSLLIWDVDGRLLERFPVGRHCWKTSLAWRADGERLLTAAHTHSTARLWSVNEGRAGEVLRGHTSYVYPVASAPDGRRLASGSWDGTLRIWNAVTGECLATLASRAGRVHALAIAPDGKRVVAATGSGALVAWDMRTGVELARTDRGKTTWECCVKWSPDGRALAAAEPDRVQLLEPATLEPREELEAPPSAITTLAFDPRGAFLAAGTVDGELALWDLGTRAIVARKKGLPMPRSLAFSPDGTRLALACDGARLALLDARTLDDRLELVGHAREVFSAVFSPDGARLFSGGRDGLLRVWDTSSGDLLGEFGGHRDYIWSVAVSPDGARVVTGSGDFDVRVWESEPVSVTDRRRREAVELAAWAGPVVTGLLAELGPSAAAERLEGDASLSDGQRAAALDALLSQASAAR
jgi:WD40 repeat protein